MKDFILKTIYIAGMILAFAIPVPMAIGIGFNLYYIWNAPLWLAWTVGIIMLPTVVFVMGKLVNKW
jgi:hypothetical protein